MGHQGDAKINIQDDYDTRVFRLFLLREIPPPPDGAEPRQPFDFQSG